MSAATDIVIGVDIGGTFTDFALLRLDTGELHIGKRLTTPDDPSRALVQGIDELCERAGVKHAELARISHATTLVTNAIIERKGCRTGLLLTEGFRDILVMGRESRYDHYDFKFERPEPVVPRSLTREVIERVRYEGSVSTPLDEASVRGAVSELRDAGVRSIAVCLLHAYRNSLHEQQIRDIVAAEFPDVDCTISSDVAPEIREYERASTTVLNAYIRPLVRQYLSSLDRQLGSRGFPHKVHVMLSNGGISSTEIAEEVPIQMIESGPAAGALAAAKYGQLLQLKHVLAFDMGGTTAKLCCIENGRPMHANTFEAARARRFRRGSGLPLLIPVIELIEIGAGGGSIAHMDHLELLKVGPHSAGAQPGPACYGQGGTNPTVTDADVVLGFIDPNHFLGGDMKLDRAAAEAAVTEKVATKLGRTAVEAAWGIYSVVNETMAAAGKRYAAERAIDVRQYTLITFGGAAPLHAWYVAKTLGISSVLFPLGAGATSAVGLCIAAPVVNLSNSYIRAVDLLDWQEAGRLLAGMEERAVEMLLSAGAERADVVLERSVDVRYRGQGYEVEVPISDLDLDQGTPDAVKAEFQSLFEQEYQRQYGRSLDVAAVEAVTWRVRASGRNPEMRIASQESGAAKATPKGKREAYFGPQAGTVECPVYDRLKLAPGAIGTGPALVEERETTVVVPPGWNWRVDVYRNLLMERADAS